MPAALRPRATVARERTGCQLERSRHFLEFASDRWVQVALSPLASDSSEDSRRNRYTLRRLPAHISMG
jgi:hypothetical protein